MSELVPNAQLVAPDAFSRRARAEMHAMAFLARYRVECTRRSYEIALRQWFGCHTLRGRMGGPGDARTSPALIRTCCGGPNMADSTSLPDPSAFWALVDRGGDDDCWLWQGRIASTGYGYLGQRGYAHRLAYQFEVGPIPGGFHIDHLCMVKQCVNPSHLEAVTPAENHLRYWATQDRTQCPHGHAKTPENTYVAPSGTRFCRECRRINQRRYTARKRGDR